MKKVFKPVPDVDFLKYHGTSDKPDIKIFVSHRLDLDSETIDNPVYIPIRCGAVYDDREGVSMLGDDTGDNISERKFVFGDLTVQYWAWKNIKADYYGIGAYNKYLSFSKDTYEETMYGAVSATALRRDDAENRYSINVDRITDLLKQYDVLVAKETAISNLGLIYCGRKIKTVQGVLDVYESTLKTPKPSKLLEQIIKEDYPDIVKAYQRYICCDEILLNYNFVMSAALYHEFCAFEFEVIGKLERKLRDQSYGELRITAYKYISNLLLQVYLDYIQNKENVQVLHLQLVCFESTYSENEVFPAFSKNNVAIMTMSSNEYAPYLGVYLQSILNCASSNNNYDILVFERNITERNKKLLHTICDGHKNVSLRFINMNAKMAGITFYVAAQHFAVEAYYRVLLPWLLPNYKKIIATDCDLIVMRDLADLYNEDITEVAIGAVRDYMYGAMLNGLFEADPELEYSEKTLKLKNPYNYVNTGVLLLNMPLLRSMFTEKEVISFCQKQKFHFQEQDVINVLMDGKIKYLDLRWNSLVSSNKDAIRAMDNFLSENAAIQLKYPPFIYHYYTHPKPWVFPAGVFAEEWWKMARLTPFYEQLIIGFQVNQALGFGDQRSGARKFADKLLPPGTRRREFAKMLLPKGSLRWRFCKRIYYIFAPRYRQKKEK